MQALFEGHKELFEGLYIYDKWDWSKKYPVIRLDFGGLNYEDCITLKDSLMDFVDDVADKWKIKLKPRNLSGRFKKLIEEIETKTGQKVVVLIDEYDKAMSDFLSEPQKAQENRIALHNFYQVLKAADESIQFIFLTGVSKFSGVSVFSALNNPRDLTIDDRYAAICGYTQEELEINFAPYLDLVAKNTNQTKDKLLDKIKYWYNGYTWDGKTSVYNPFSTLTFFDLQTFSNYWIKTGASISNEILLKNADLLETLFKPITVSDTFFNGYDLGDIKDNAYLFQAGYLTIKDAKLVDDRLKYFLEIPNQEVKEALSLYMLSAYSKMSGDDIDKIQLKIKEQVKNSDVAGLENSLKSIFARIPYYLYEKKEFPYHAIFIVIMLFAGFKVQAEVATNLGRIDAVWEQ
jgi:hypothetical protein